MQSPPWSPVSICSSTSGSVRSENAPTKRSDKAIVCLSRSGQCSSPRKRRWPPAPTRHESHKRSSLFIGRKVHASISCITAASGALGGAAQRTRRAHAGIRLAHEEDHIANCHAVVEQRRAVREDIVPAPHGLCALHAANNSEPRVARRLGRSDKSCVLEAVGGHPKDGRWLVVASSTRAYRAGMKSSSLAAFDAASLAAWGANALKPIFEGQGHASRWRMLEYWWQVELYMRPPEGAEVVGDFELPYRTAFAHRSPELGVKWSDLVYRRGNTNLVVELKDLGPNPLRVHKNAEGVGLDLAALLALNGDATLSWYTRLGTSEKASDELDARRDGAVRDAGRKGEYSRVASTLAGGLWRGAVLLLSRDAEDEKKVVAAVMKGREALAVQHASCVVGTARVHAFVTE